MKTKREHFSQEYWDKLLLDYGLTMEKGRNEKILYVGGNAVLDRIAGEQEAHTGRVSPKPPSE